MRYLLTTPLGSITIRPYAERDIPRHVSYLHDSPRLLLEQIGFDYRQFPDRESCAELFRGELSLARKEGIVTRMVGEFEGQAVSLTTLEIPPNEQERYLHYHILEPTLRGRGLGAPLLVVPMLALMDHHRLDRVYLEPGADNPPINLLLAKLGFALLGSLDKAAGQWALQVRVNRYEATRPQVQQLFASMGARAVLTEG